MMLVTAGSSFILALNFLSFFNALWMHINDIHQQTHPLSQFSNVIYLKPQKHISNLLMHDCYGTV